MLASFLASHIMHCALVLFISVASAQEAQQQADAPNPDEAMDDSIAQMREMAVAQMSSGVASGGPLQVCNACDATSMERS